MHVFCVVHIDFESSRRDLQGMSGEVGAGCRNSGEQKREERGKSFDGQPLALQALLITINFPRIDARSGPER